MPHGQSVQSGCLWVYRVAPLSAVPNSRAFVAPEKPRTCSPESPSSLPLVPGDRGSALCLYGLARSRHSV